MQGIGDWAVKRALISRDEIAFITDDKQWSYGEFNTRVDKLANTLRDTFKVRRGDRISAVVINSVECLEILFAAAKLGAIFTPINVRLTAREIAYILDDLGTELLFVHDMFAQAREAAAEPGVRVRNIVAIGPEYDALMAAADATPVIPQAMRNDVAVIMYTSGTTGRPKGAMLTHENLRGNAAALVPSFGLSASDTTITALPMFHIGGLGLHTLPFIYVGATNVILKSFVPTQVAEMIAQHRPTQLLLVPTMWEALMALPDIDSLDWSSLNLAIISGAPASVPVIKFFNKLGVPLAEGFGMTECAPGIAMLAPEFVSEKAGAIGRSLFDVDTRIVDEFDQDVAVGEVGELLIRGDNVFVGYWMRPEESEQALRGGWFHSGDMGREDEDGFITLVDRKKDMLISGGENIYPREIELALSEMPGIGAVSVVGTSDAKWGETPVAFIVASGSPVVTEEDVIAFARERLAKFKTPTRVEFIEAFPMTATGKIQKNLLRAQLS